MALNKSRACYSSCLPFNKVWWSFGGMFFSFDDSWGFIDELMVPEAGFVQAGRRHIQHKRFSARQQ